VGFATPDKDAAQGFHLRLIMTNFLVPFNCTFAELGRKPGVAAMWAEHVERSAPGGGAPRGRWRAEAAAALAWLQSPELAGEPVRFICEVQMVLEATFDVRAHMHEVRSAAASRRVCGGGVPRSAARAGRCALRGMLRG